MTNLFKINDSSYSRRSKCLHLAYMLINILTLLVFAVGEYN